MTRKNDDGGGPRLSEQAPDRPETPSSPSIVGNGGNPVETRNPSRVETDLSLVEAFDLGFEWAMSLRGQTLEDSRAVGRTLTSDLFDRIADRMDLDGFNSFESADLGICAAKAIIHNALKENPHA